MHILILQSLQSSKSFSDSSSVYLRQVTTDSLFNLNNPVLYSALVLIIVLAVIYIFYKYVIKAMQRHYIEEKKDLQHQHIRLLAALAEYDPDPVFRFDNTGTIIMANQAAIELYSGYQLVSKKLYEIIPESVDIDFDSCIKNEKLITISSRLRDSYYNFTLRGIYHLNIGQIYGNDVTNLKRTEHDLKVALRKSTESDRIKTFFLSQMSHEIRTPINAILGFNAIIKDQASAIMNDELNFSFGAIESGCMRLIRTIDQLLDMSQLRSGSYEIDNEKIELHEIINSLIYTYEQEAKTKNLKIIFENNLTEAEIIKDKYSVSKIISGLLDNAVKFTDQGTINIKLDKNEIGKVYISITDTGIGISKEYMNNLFTMFSQEHMGYNRKYEGNGLGLALCKRFADMNNIAINVLSKRDEGSTFTLTF